MMNQPSKTNSPFGSFNNPFDSYYSESLRTLQALKKCMDDFSNENRNLNQYQNSTYNYYQHTFENSRNYRDLKAKLKQYTSNLPISQKILSSQSDKRREELKYFQINLQPFITQLKRLTQSVLQQKINLNCNNLYVQSSFKNCQQYKKNIKYGLNQLREQLTQTLKYLKSQSNSNTQIKLSQKVLYNPSLVNYQNKQNQQSKRQLQNKKFIQLAKKPSQQIKIQTQNQNQKISQKNNLSKSSIDQYTPHKEIQEKQKNRQNPKNKQNSKNDYVAFEQQTKTHFVPLQQCKQCQHNQTIIQKYQEQVKNVKTCIQQLLKDIKQLNSNIKAQQKQNKSKQYQPQTKQINKILQCPGEDNKDQNKSNIYSLIEQAKQHTRQLSIKIVRSNTYVNFMEQQLNIFKEQQARLKQEIFVLQQQKMNSSIKGKSNQNQKLLKTLQLKQTNKNNKKQQKYQIMVQEEQSNKSQLDIPKLDILKLDKPNFDKYQLNQQDVLNKVSKLFNKMVMSLNLDKIFQTIHITQKINSAQKNQSLNQNKQNTQSQLQYIKNKLQQELQSLSKKKQQLQGLKGVQQFIEQPSDEFQLTQLIIDSLNKVFQTQFEVMNLQTQQLLLQNTLSNLKQTNKLKKSLQGLKQEIKLNSDKYEQKSKQISIQRTIIRTHKIQIQRMKQQIKNLSNRKTDILNSKQIDNQSLEKQTKTIEQKKNNFIKQIFKDLQLQVELKVSYQNLKLQKQTLSHELKAHQLQIDQLNKQIESCKNENRQFEVQLKNQYKKKIQKLQTQLKTKDDNIKTINTQLKVTNDKSQQLASQLSIQTSKVNDLTQKLQNQKIIFKKLQQQLKELKVLKQTTQNQIERLNSKNLQQLSQNLIKNHKNQLQNSENKLKQQIRNDQQIQNRASAHITQQNKNIQTVYQSKFNQLRRSYENKFKMQEQINKKHLKRSEQFSQRSAELNVYKQKNTYMKEYLDKIHKVTTNFSCSFESQDQKDKQIESLKLTQNQVDKYCQKVYMSLLKAIQFFGERLGLQSRLTVKYKNNQQEVLKQAAELQSRIIQLNKMNQKMISSEKNKIKSGQMAKQNVFSRSQRYLQQLQKFIRNYQTQLDRIVKDNSQLSKQLTTSKQGHEQQKTKLMNTQGQLNKIKQQLSRKTNQLNQLQEQYKKNNNSIQINNQAQKKQLKIQIRQLTETSNNLYQQLEVQTNFNKQLQDKLKHQTNKLQAQIKRSQQNINNKKLLQTHNTNLNNQILELTDSNRLYKDNITQLNDQNKKLKQQNKKLLTSFRQLEGQNQMNQIQSQNFKNTIKSLNDQLQKTKISLQLIQDQKRKTQLQSRSTQTNKSLQLQRKQQQLITLKSKLTQLQQKLTQITQNKQTLLIQLAQSNKKFKQNQTQYQLLTQQSTALQQKSSAQISRLKEQCIYLNNVIKKVSKEISKKVNLNIQITPQNILQTLQTFNPSIGMKLITSSVLLGLDKERTQITNKIQNFMQKTIKRTDIIYKFQPSFKSFMHILVSKQYNTTSFFIIYKTSRGKIFGSFSESLLKKTFLFSLPYQNQGQMQRHQLQKDDKQISFYMGQKKSEMISSIAVQQGKFLVYGANQMTVSIRDLTNPIKGNSDVLGGRYFQNVDWRKIFRQNDESKVTISELEFHRVQFE